jgi:hypothetical protein
MDEKEIDKLAEENAELVELEHPVAENSSFFDKLGVGWKLGGQMRGLIFKDKSLLIYMIAMLIVSYAWSWFVIFQLANRLNGLIIGSGLVSELAFSVFVYFGYAFIALYFSAAMLIAWRQFVSGKRIGILSAMGRAARLIPNLFLWSIFYALMITAYEFIRSLLRGYARLLFDFLGELSIMAATFFVLPIIVEEKAGPITAVKKSFDTLTDSFGATFGGFVYINIYANVIMLVGILMMACSLYLSGFIYYNLYFNSYAINASSFTSNILTLLLLIAGVVVFLFGEVLGAAMMGVFKITVYDYVNTGKLPDGIKEEDIKGAISSTGEEIVPAGPMGGSSDSGWDYVGEDIENREKS